MLILKQKKPIFCKVLPVIKNFLDANSISAIIIAIRKKNAMKEKQPTKLSESCRLMQDSSKVELFRSEAANDEFDGLARYSERKMAERQFGWQRGKVLVP